MSIFSRFFGRKADDAAPAAEGSSPLVAVSGDAQRASLQVVFPGKLPVQADALTRALRAYHPSMAGASAEIEPDMEQLIALAGWGDHVIRMVGFDAPLPEETLEACVAPAHYPAEIKAEVRAHASHVLLYYAGRDEDPLEQYVALAAVAGALAEAGALAVMNEAAHTSLPAGIFTRESLGDDTLELLRSLPLTMLYCGFVKYEVDGTDGVWMRTYGAEIFGLSDFAALAEGHHQGEYYSGIFNNIMAYLLNSGAEMAAGHTMQIGENAFLKLREPAESEYFLQGPGHTLVAEIIAADAINKPDSLH